MSICDFTLNHYSYMCKAIVESSYDVCTYNDKDTKGPRIILRHDVDLSLGQSVALAQIEHKYGLTATYFIWLTSPFYNPFEPASVRIINQIISLGHRIGLHFDPASCADITNSSLNCIEKEALLIESFFGASIDAVSFHRPVPHLLGGANRIGRFINSYGDKFYSHYKYLSDSCRQWREGCLCKHLSSGKFPRLHVLTHPVWWTEENKGFDNRVYNYVADKTELLHRKLKSNISRYKV